MTEATKTYWETELPKMTDAELDHEYVALTDNNHGDVAAMVRAEISKRRGQRASDNEIMDACVAALGDRGAVASYDPANDPFADTGKIFGVEPNDEAVSNG